jgi:hypothetical protein
MAQPNKALDRYKKKLPSEQLNQWQKGIGVEKLFFASSNFCVIFFTLDISSEYPLNSVA